MEKEVWDIYFFSGTGNTFLLVNKLAEILEHNSIVNLYRIEKSNPQEIDTNHNIGLAFPIAFFSTYPFIWDFIYKMPRTKTKTKIFMLASMAGISLSIMGRLKNVLFTKGYNPIGAKTIIMPSNFVIIYKEKKNKKVIEKGLQQVQNFANNLINDKTNWKRVPLFSNISYFGYALIFRTKLIKLFHKTINWFVKFDKMKCKQCGLCIKICPVNNIKINKEIDDYPIFGENCEICMRCFSYCNQKALILNLNPKEKTYKATKINEILNL